MGDEELRTAVQIVCGVLVEDNVGITAHCIWQVSCPLSTQDCVPALSCRRHDVGKFV
jgi:hypothetical protein